MSGADPSPSGCIYLAICFYRARHRSVCSKLNRQSISTPTTLPTWIHPPATYRVQTIV